MQPDADFEECADCGARFPLSDIRYPEPERSERNTQVGWLAGQCPECGADLQLGLDRVRNVLAPPR